MRHKMDRRIQILNSKLLLPRSSDTIRRERLYPLLDEIPKKRLTTVIAGAGYGKTTLIAEVGKYLGLDTVWYSLDTSDRDFMPFLSYLIEGLKRYSPELGVETFRRIDDVQILNREREAILTVFLSEIEKLVKNDLIIVLDDYHLIQDSNEMNESLKFLLEHLPPLVHLIIISRSDPDLPLSKLRAIREVLDIREADLVFALSEIERLYL
jgi:ATP/maltotriose-dependent transcriptional regulator MalT